MAHSPENYLVKGSEFQVPVVLGEERRAKLLLGSDF